MGAGVFVGIDPERASRVADRMDHGGDELVVVARRVRAALAPVGGGDGPASGLEAIARWCDRSARDLRHRVATASEQADSFLYLVGAFGATTCPDPSREAWLGQWFPARARDGRASPAEIARFLVALAPDERLRLAKEVAHRFEHVKVGDLAADAAYLRAALAPLRKLLAAPAVAAYVDGGEPDDETKERAHLARVLAFKPPRRTADPLSAFVGGLVAGDLDHRGYDNPGGRWGRLAGQLLSGFAIAGNVRDALADAQQGDIEGFALNTVGIIPGLGDAADGVRAVDRAGQAARIMDEDRALQIALDLQETHRHLDLLDRVDDAVRSTDKDVRLEGEVAKMVSADLVAFRKDIVHEGMTVTDIDVETSQAIIEVTTRERHKIRQVQQRLTSLANPDRKAVILFAPRYTKGAAKAVADAGGVVVRTEAELKAVLSKLGKRG